MSRETGRWKLCDNVKHVTVSLCEHIFPSQNRVLEGTTVCYLHILEQIRALELHHIVEQIRALDYYV